MDEEINKTKYKPLGEYAVVNYGSNERWRLPFYLSRDTSMMHFTADISMARFFSDLKKAQEAAEMEREWLRAEGHPLHDHIRVMRIFGQMVEEEEG